MFSWGRHHFPVPPVSSLSQRQQHSYCSTFAWLPPKQPTCYSQSKSAGGKALGTAYLASPALIPLKCRDAAARRLRFRRHYFAVG